MVVTKVCTSGILPRQTRRLPIVLLLMELTITEAARTLDCSVDTVRRHIRRGKLNARKDEHGRYLIRFDENALPKARAKSTGEMKWLSSSTEAAGHPEAQVYDEFEDFGSVGLVPPWRAVEDFPAPSPQRRADDPSLQEQLEQLRQERTELVIELQEWRDQAMAAQVALEELRRLLPETISASSKHNSSWWRRDR